MKLKSYIFRWVTLVTLLPATALGLLASYYVQNLYHQDAIDDIHNSLETIANEISHSLYDAQRLMLKLPESLAMQQFLPVLDEARLNEQHIDYDYKLYILSAFLRQYQSVISRFDTFRILDIRGNTLLKIHDGLESKTRYESLEPYVIMDKEILYPEKVKELSELPNDSVSFIELPQTRDEMGQETNKVIPNGIVPLHYNGYRVGYLAMTIHGTNLDQVLELATRLYNGQLIIAEIEEENKVRNGQILFSDATQLHFSDLKSTTDKLQNLNHGAILDAYQEAPYGSISLSSGHNYYYIEYYPYANSLTSWLIISDIQQKAFSSPFDNIRLAIWVLSSIAVLGSLFLAQFISQSIATPIIHLANNLKTFSENQQAICIKSPIDEIQDSSESFNYMSKTLYQAQQERIKAEKMMLQNAKLASLGQMAAGIGHEINNPLNNIRSLSRLIRRTLEKKPHTEKIDTDMLEDIVSLDEEVLRASEIVQGVLSFSRQIPDKSFTQLYLNDLIKDLAGLVNQEAKRANVSIIGIEEIIVHDKCIVLGDRGKLQQALVNILLNAIQASPRDSQIDIALSTQKQTLTLSFRDYGGGIDHTIKDQIFDPFFTTKEVGQGTGLGLSISLAIINNHKGTLSIENISEGNGVLVLITLPLASNKKQC